MGENIKNALNNIPVVQIWQFEPSFTHVNYIWLILSISYANQAAQFISTYGQNLNGPEAAWVN